MRRSIYAIFLLVLMTGSSAAEPPSGEQEIWKLGQQFSLAAVMYHRNANPELVGDLLDRARQQARSAGIEVIIPQPPRQVGAPEGMPGGSRYLADTERVLAHMIARKYGNRHVRLFKLAIRLNTLLLVYGLDDTTDTWFAVTIHQDGIGLGLPVHLWKPVVDQINARVPFKDLRSVVFVMQREVSAFLAAARSSGAASVEEAPQAANCLAPLRAIGRHLNAGMTAFLAGAPPQVAFAPWQSDAAPGGLIQAIDQQQIHTATNLGFEFELVFLSAGKPTYYLRTFVYTDGKEARFISFAGRRVEARLYVRHAPLSAYSGEAAPFAEAARAVYKASLENRTACLPLIDAEFFRRAGVPEDVRRKPLRDLARSRTEIEQISATLKQLRVDEVRLRLDDQAFLAVNAAGVPLGIIRGNFHLSKDRRLGFEVQRFRPFRK